MDGYLYLSVAHKLFIHLVDSDSVSQADAHQPYRNAKSPATPHQPSNPPSTPEPLSGPSTTLYLLIQTTTYTEYYYYSLWSPEYIVLSMLLNNSLKLPLLSVKHGLK